jgi:hypothetical protein
MTTEDFIIDLFCRIDDQMQDVAKHSQAHLWAHPPRVHGNSREHIGSVARPTCGRAGLYAPYLSIAEFSL